MKDVIKLPIIATMSENQKRFNDIRRAVPKLTTGMLSKEVWDLEMNGIVKLEVIQSYPVVFEYELTDSVKRLADVMDKMIQWELPHRETI